MNNLAVRHGPVKAFVRINRMDYSIRAFGSGVRQVDHPPRPPFLTAVPEQTGPPLNTPSEISNRIDPFLKEEVAKGFLKDDERTEEIKNSSTRGGSNRDNPATSVVDHNSNIKVSDAMDYRGGRNFSAEIREWVIATKGDFSATDCDKELGITTNGTSATSATNGTTSYRTLMRILGRLVTDEKILKRLPKRGWFHRIERDSAIIDFKSANPGKPLEIHWPAACDLGKEVNLYPKNIVVVAGESNAGKTALLLNFIKLNQDRHRIIYFSSEMAGEELRIRVSGVQIPPGAPVGKGFRKVTQNQSHSHLPKKSRHESVSKIIQTPL